MLSGGAAVHVESLHGETITVLSGADAGKSFTAVNETEQDVVFEEQLGMDPRAKRVLRFRVGGLIPNLTSQDRIQTDDGRIWIAIRRPDSGYLTIDFELSEWVAGKDN